MNTLIQRLEITAEELEDKNLKPMAATVREAIKALSDNSSKRQVDAGASNQRKQLIDFLNWLEENSNNSVDRGWVDDYLKVKN